MRKSLMLMGILDDADVEWLLAQGEQKRLARGTVLIQKGGPIDALYIILSGGFTVSVSAMHERPIATLLSGEVVGEISFVDSRPPLASVIASEDSRVLSIRRDKLFAKIDRDASFAARFYRALAAFLADRLRITTSRLGFGDAGQDVDPGDELNDDVMDRVSLAAVRFDGMLKRLGSD
jgi:CRP/FNR family transcriptional regulator, cyclic AMP receptor protein